MVVVTWPSAQLSCRPAPIIPCHNAPSSDATRLLGAGCGSELRPRKRPNARVRFQEDPRRPNPTYLGRWEGLLFALNSNAILHSEVGPPMPPRVACRPTPKQSW